MKFLNDNNLKKPWAAYTVAICSGVLLYLIISHFYVIVNGIRAVFGFIQPVVIGLVIAYILNPLAKFAKRTIFHNVRNERAAWLAGVIFSVIVVVVGIVILLVTLIPQLLDSIGTLLSNISTYSRTISNLLDRLNTSASDLHVDISGFTNFSQGIVASISKYLTRHNGDLISTVTGTVSGIVNGVISFIISIYFLTDKKHLLDGCRRLIRLLVAEKRYSAFADFWNRCNSILSRYIVFDLLDGLIIGVSNSVFMLIARMPYVALISVVVGVTNLVPTFGPIVGALIGAFILVLNNPWQALWFLIFTLILQTIDGYVLKPKMFGGALSVPGIWILIMIIIGGRMFGVVGILIAIPMTAILNFIYHDFILVRLEARRKKVKARQEPQPEKKP